jgi:hypothetical protein
MRRRHRSINTVGNSARCDTEFALRQAVFSRTKTIALLVSPSEAEGRYQASATAEVLQLGCHAVWDPKNRSISTTKWKIWEDA